MPQPVTDPVIVMPDPSNENPMPDAASGPGHRSTQRASAPEPVAPVEKTSPEAPSSDAALD